LKVVVWGTGETGKAAARVMLAKGHEVRLVDEAQSKVEGNSPVKMLAPSDMEWADLVIPSPGVPRYHSLFAYAKKVLSEIEVAASMLRGKIIAITGTNGKTTTTSLVHTILQAAGEDVGIGGNISPPMITLVDANPRYVVVEISSFQLEWIERFRPFIGVCMNITPDHLDRYHDMEEYVYYKLRLFENMEGDDIAVIYNDDPYKDRVRRPRRVGFSVQKGDIRDGAYIQDGKIMFHGEIEGVGPRVPDPAMLGRGTIEDMLASALVTRYLGVEVGVMEEVFANFKVIHHRFERAGELGGVIFMDDSKATNVGAVDIALKSIAGKVILILGGKDKGGDFGKLAASHRDKIKKAILMGEASARIELEIADKVAIERAFDMQDAVDKAYALAGRGDIVLLSPGCASFDMFNSYAHRGEVFVACVKELIAKKMS
jgi:UDP-N-acetylmuramoylalanine--D-glutamate ligase